MALLKTGIKYPISVLSNTYRCKNCSYCKTVLDGSKESSMKCPHCGEELQLDSNPDVDKSKSKI
ncbi:MAG: hypothetical protein WC119_02005 [Synergistaceae bacterium]